MSLLFSIARDISVKRVASVLMLFLDGKTIFQFSETNFLSQPAN